MKEKKENTLWIDPDTGAVVVNNTMRIEPEQTLEEFVQSDVYGTYVHEGGSDRTKVLLLKNVAGQDVSISVMSLGTKIIKDVIIEIPHAGAKKSEQVGNVDFKFLREILYQSLSGDDIKEDRYHEETHSGVILYKVPWGIVKIYETSESFAYLEIMYRRWEDKEEKTLRIDPKNGAIVINEMMRIEPDWTLEEFEQSDVYRKYIHIGRMQNARILKINNVDGKEIFVDVWLRDAKIIKITIAVAHYSQGEYSQMQESDFLVLREILSRSFTGCDSKDDEEWYLFYEFAWGDIVLNFDRSRGSATEADIWYRR